MQKFICLYFKGAVFLIFLISLLILVLYFISLISGFYFTGDLITFFEPAFPGKRGDLLSVFVWHMNNYPPLLSYILNLLRFVPVSFISQHCFYLLISALLGVFVTYLISQRFTKVKKWQVILVALLLFSGPQRLLFLLALPESLFFVLWLTLIFAVEKFIATQKERYLLLFMISSSLIPITKWQGIPILLSLEVVIILFALLTWRKGRYSLSLIFVSLLASWIPLFATLIGNFLLHQSFFGYFEAQTVSKRSLISTQLEYLISGVFQDLILLFLAAAVLGTWIKWNKQIKNFTLLASYSTAVYYFAVVSGLARIPANNSVPHRYFLPAYPLLILVAVGFGSFLSFRFARFHKTAITAILFVVSILGYNLWFSITRLQQEIKSPQSMLLGAEYSADIRKFCLGKTPKKYLLLQESSRNWVAESLGFYCQPITIIPTGSKTFQLPKDAYLFTPYNIIERNLILITDYKGDKNVRLYKVLDNTVLDIQKEFQKEIPLDWFNGAKFASIQELVELNQNNKWVPFESEELGFSTRIPISWHIYSVLQRGGIFLISNIFRGDQNNQADYYVISVQKIHLNDITLDKLFPNDKFQIEKKGDYSIYTASTANTQDYLFSVFISKDGKDFIRYTTAPISISNLTSVQEEVLKDLHTVVGNTKLKDS